MARRNEIDPGAEALAAALVETLRGDGRPRRGSRPAPASRSRRGGEDPIADLTEMLQGRGSSTTRLPRPAPARRRKRSPAARRRRSS